MDILVTINDNYAKYLNVTLCSFFEYNKGSHRIFCLYNDLSNYSKNVLTDYVEQNNSEIIFLKADVGEYKDFPVTSMLTVECYFILLAHKVLPTDIDKILYLDSDLIILDSLDELYGLQLDDNYLAAAGQIAIQENGKWYKNTAKPENGSCFNSGVVLFNVAKFRENVSADTYMLAAKKSNYNFSLADQGMLNLLFWDKCMYLNPLEYNFRISLYENQEIYEKTKDAKIKIIHYVNHDYYKINVPSKPWTLTLDDSDITLLEETGIINHTYEMECIDSYSYKMQRVWWEYAKKTLYYDEMICNMKRLKEKTFNSLFGYDSLDEKRQRWSKMYSDFRLIEEKKLTDVNILKKYKYKDIETFIDSISPERAIVTMNNLFFYAFCLMKEKKTIKVGFLVYSISEWQCEDLYRLFESKEGYEPYIVVCGYNHGTRKEVRNTYRITAEYFRQRNYVVRYAGYMENASANQVEDMDIIFSFLPYKMYPLNVNIGELQLRQLSVHVSYGMHLVSRDVLYYKDSYYDKPVYKMSWMVNSLCNSEKCEIAKQQRLSGYNIVVNGHVKFDQFIKNQYECDARMWGNVNNTKIIWAPHFNLQEGMNGTFQHNYQFFLNYAKNHPNISWVVKPHPRMSWGVVAYGVFNSTLEYEAYLDEWRSLDNANVIEQGEYYDIFATSDAMILDSVSFIGEYQYTHKPILILEPNEQRGLSEFGKRLYSVNNRCNGDDFKSIEKFILNVASGINEKSLEQKEFFDTELDYVSINGCYASEKIWQLIEAQLR